MNRLIAINILLWPLLLNSLSAYAVNLSAEVDRDRLTINESLRLRVTVDINTNQKIDFSQLQKQFDIINTQRQSRRSNSNGQWTAATQWTLILTPKETGQLLIPSFELDGNYSQPITITVNASNDAATGGKGNGDVFLQTSVSKDSVYVQEQVLLTLRLYYRIGLSSYNDEELKLNNVTTALVAENTFQTQLQGKNYNVLEKIYALHPQSSGQLLIPSRSWRLEKSQGAFSFGRSGNPYIYLKSDPVSIDVKPIPGNHNADNWLPSTVITLDAQWQQPLTQATVGEPLKLKLLITGNGLSASQLPDITLEDNNDFTIYSDLPETDNSESVTGIIGTRTQHFAIIPKQTGKLIFPSIRLQWWNISADKQETTTIPQQTIIVSNSQINTTQNLPPLTPDNIPQQASNNLHSSDIPSLWIWQISTLLLALLCILLLSIQILFWKKAKPNKNTTPYSQLLNDKPKIKHRVKTMETAVKNQDWITLRTHILDWGKIATDNNRLQSLGEISIIFPELDGQLQQLDNQIYGTKADDSWNPQLLIEAIKKASIKKVKQEQEKLMALYNTH